MVAIQHIQHMYTLPKWMYSDISLWIKLYTFWENEQFLFDCFVDTIQSLFLKKKISANYFQIIVSEEMLYIYIAGTLLERPLNEYQVKKIFL